MEAMIRIKLVRSPICTPEKHKRVVRGWACGKSTRSWNGPIRRYFAAW